MPQYPPFRPGDNQHAYNLGCQLLDLQDRLLVKRKNKRVRAMLQLDMPRQLSDLSRLSFELQNTIEGVVSQQKQLQVLNEITCLNKQLEALAIALGL